MAMNFISTLCNQFDQTFHHGPMPSLRTPWVCTTLLRLCRIFFLVIITALIFYKTADTHVELSYHHVTGMCGPEKSVDPIIAVHRIAGMFPVKGDLRLDLSLLFTNFLAVLVLIIYSLEKKSRSLFIDETSRWTSFVQFAVVASVTLVCILHVTLGRSKIRSYLAECRSIHDRFVGLQFRPAYSLQRNVSQIKTLLGIVIPLAFSDTYIYEYNRPSKLYLLLYNFCDAVCFLEILLFGQLVGISYTFLAMINRYLRAKKVDIFHLKERKKVGELLKMFHEVHGICRSLNSTFSVPLLALTALSFVCMLVDSYHAVNSLSESLRKTEVELHFIGFCSRVFWVLYQVYKLFVLLDACCVIQREASQFTVELREIIAAANPEQIVDMEELIRTHHMIYKKVGFTAADFYELNFSLMISIVGAVGSYLVILIQFRSNGKVFTNDTLLTNQTVSNSTMTATPVPTAFTTLVDLPVNTTDAP